MNACMFWGGSGGVRGGGTVRNFDCLKVERVSGGEQYQALLTLCECLPIRMMNAVSDLKSQATMPYNAAAA